MTGPPATGCAGAKLFVIEVSAHGTVEIAADALLSSGLISVPTGADTVAVLFSSLLLGYSAHGSGENWLLALEPVRRS